MVEPSETSINMATYNQIATWVKERYGISIKSCWIADRKFSHGLTAGRPDRFKGASRKYPCPENKRQIVDSALKHFGMIP